MRDLIAVIGVVIVAVCVGVTSAYLSVDLTPPGLDLIRPPKPAVAAQLKLEERQSSIQAEASECKYCVAVAELAQRFARHAKSARQQATALRETISLESTDANRDDELKRAERAADGAEAAAAALTSWASRCKGEDFCRAPVKRTNVACSADASGSVSAALSLAASVKRAASGCAAATCPSVDCKASASLRSDVQYVERMLSTAGGRYSVQSSGKIASQLPVGASSLSAEIRRVSDESIYISKMLPLMLDGAAQNQVNGQLPKLASDMVDERAVSAAQLATVMEHAAELSGDPKNDLRSEAAWRLKSLAANLAQLGLDTQAGDGAAINWRAATESLGAALIDVARMQAMLDRATDQAVGITGCANSAPAAAQQLRQALAMLDLCRMRSACTSRGTPANAANITQAVTRSVPLAERLVVQEVGSGDTVQASESDEQIQPIQQLRTQHGVCMKAAELREATLLAPAAAQSVAQGVAPVVQPVAGPVAPQDLVNGAVGSAIQASAPAAEEDPALLQTAAPVAHESEAVPAAAPPAESPNFTGNLLSPSTPAFTGGDVRPVSAGGQGH